MLINNKNIFISGGAGGIGKEFIKHTFALAGHIGVLDINEEALIKLKNDYPNIHTFCGDISDYQTVQSTINEFSSICGKLDIVINNAAVIHNSLLIGINKQGFYSYDQEMWNNVINCNLNAVFYLTSTAVLRMIEKRVKGLVINISSICAAGNAGQSAYSAAKSGVNALTVTWAKELGLWGIRVAGIAPGYVDTTTTLNSMSDEVLAEWKDRIPLKRFAEPKEIVDAILFIVSNDYYTGRTLEIDGGLRI